MHKSKRIHHTKSQTTNVETRHALSPSLDISQSPQCFGRAFLVGLVDFLCLMVNHEVTKYTKPILKHFYLICSKGSAEAKPYRQRTQVRETTPDCNGKPTATNVQFMTKLCRSSQS